MAKKLEDLLMQFCDERIRQIMARTGLLIERIDTVSSTVNRAIELFGSPEAALAWLDTPLAALGGKAPADVLCQPGGEDTINDLLGRIAHGLPA